MDSSRPAFSATKILLPIDFSENSEAGLEAASGLAKQFHAAIHLVHIVPEFPDFNGSDFFPETAVTRERMDLLGQKLSDCKDKLEAEGIAATFSVETGNDVVGKILLVIEREHADMVVLSTHGLTGWRPLILGSIAEKVIKQAACTLLLLKPMEPAAAPAEPAGTTYVPVLPATALRASSAPVQAQTAAGRRLDLSAEELAELGGETEQRYDEAHPIFSK